LNGKDIIKPKDSNGFEFGGLGDNDEAIIANKKKLELINEEEDAKVNSMINQFKSQSEKKTKEYEQRKAAI
jgi:hypothetical protein